MTPETQSELAMLKAKARDGTATLEDFIRGVQLMKGDRTNAQQRSDSSRRKAAKAAIPSADDMLAELG